MVAHTGSGRAERKRFLKSSVPDGPVAVLLVAVAGYAPPVAVAVVNAEAD